MNCNSCRVTSTTASRYWWFCTERVRSEPSSTSSPIGNCFLATSHLGVGQRRQIICCRWPTWRWPVFVSPSPSVFAEDMNSCKVLCRRLSKKQIFVNFCNLANNRFMNSMHLNLVDAWTFPREPFDLFSSPSLRPPTPFPVSSFVDFHRLFPKLWVSTRLLSLCLYRRHTCRVVSALSSAFSVTEADLDSSHFCFHGQRHLLHLFFGGPDAFRSTFSRPARRAQRTSLHKSWLAAFKVYARKNLATLSSVESQLSSRENLNPGFGLLPWLDTKN